MEKEKKGLLAGGICFSLTLPATTIAVDYFETTVVGLGRTVIVALLVGIILLVRKEKVPTLQQLKV